MSWFRVDDHFPDHPKILRAGGEAGWLYIAGGCYCARHLTDGAIPKAAVGTLTTLKSVPKLVAALVREGLWHDRGDHYEVHDYLAYNPSREDVENVRRTARERRAKGGRRSGEVRANKTNPVPVPEVLTEPSDGAKRRGCRIPVDFDITDVMLDWAGEHAPAIDLVVETTKFKNYWESKPGKDATKLDWSKTWQNWILEAVLRRPGSAPRQSPTRLSSVPEPKMCSVCGNTRRIFRGGEQVDCDCTQAVAAL